MNIVNIINIINIIAYNSGDVDGYIGKSCSSFRVSWN
jgi:hypothetical protein